MTEPMTDARLAEIEALEAAATEGPWVVMPNCVSVGARVTWFASGEVGYTLVASPDDMVEPHPQQRADAALIAAARTAVPEMAAEIRRLRAELAEWNQEVRHEPFVTCGHHYRYFTGARFGRVISEKVNAVRQRAEAVAEANRARKAEAEALAELADLRARLAAKEA